MFGAAKESFHLAPGPWACSMAQSPRQWKHKPFALTKTDWVHAADNGHECILSGSQTHCFLGAVSLLCRRPWLTLPAYPAVACDSWQLLQSDPPMCHFEEDVYSRWTQVSSLKQRFKGCMWKCSLSPVQAHPECRASSGSHSCDKPLHSSPLPGTPHTRGLFLFFSKLQGKCSV